MRLYEITEKKKDNKVTGDAPKRRNFVAKAVTRMSGAGPHSPKKFNRKEKHKNKEID